MGKELIAIYNLLYRLGVTANYTGFFHTAYAVSLCLEQPERLLLVTKWLYPEVAKQYHTKWTAVERNIRTVGCIIWRENRPLLEYLARRPLIQRPRNAQLLAVLAASLDGPLLAHELAEAAAFPGENDDMGAANEPADEGSAEAVATKDDDALRELQIGSNDMPSAFVAV